jgi:ATP-dependent DNA helicase RecG
MEKSDALKRIYEALVFASRDEFRSLGMIKGLETMILTLIGLIKRDYASGPECLSENLVLFERLFSGFDAREAAEKKAILEKALVCLRELEELSEGDHSEQIPAASERCLDTEACLNRLASSIGDIKGVGPRILQLFHRKGVETVQDLFFFLPRKYDDRRTITRIAETTPGRIENVIASVSGLGLKWYGRKKVFEVVFQDGSGTLKAKWFQGNERYLRDIFTPGQKAILTGEVRAWRNAREIIHPDFEILDESELPESGSLSFGRIVPIYSETEGLHQKTIRRIVNEALNRYGRFIINAIPEVIRRRNRLVDLGESIRDIHFPSTTEDIALYNNMESDALRTLIFDDFFFFELGMALRQSGNMRETGIAFTPSEKLIGGFHASLGFELTGAQRRVIAEIVEDMKRPCPMNRLLLGDVGCGKTVVAVTAMLLACSNGHQCAMMAPTEILAEQHFRQITAWVSGLGMRTALLTGKMNPKECREIHDSIEQGQFDIVVGTQALIQEKSIFKSLGLAVIDEQHRFGVMQRAVLRRKGTNPDVLFMTATPIPRTLAMTAYGDLDVSAIDEMPPGKAETKTGLFYEKDRLRVYEIIRKELQKQHQVFIVYPLVEESENLDLKDATRMAAQLQSKVFPEYRIGLIHGKMKAADKDCIMQAFSAKDLDLLVATTVVEVGIDIPQASLIVIEHADRFGLSQLHQLRGRVGRGNIRSYCILMASGARSDAASKRLRIMAETNDGFKIAEADLEIRGPGEFLGVRQSGLPDFRVGHIVRDSCILNEARREAFAVVKADPDLSRPENALLKKVLMARWGSRLTFLEAG